MKHAPLPEALRSVPSEVLEVRDASASQRENSRLRAASSSVVILLTNIPAHTKSTSVDPEPDAGHHNYHVDVVPT
jgi:hypothetical protein